MQPQPAPAPVPVASPLDVVALGAQLAAAGQGAVGRSVQRYWPEEGGWWDAHVTAFNSETKEHQLTYNRGKVDESFEWINLRELTNDEFRNKSMTKDTVGLVNQAPGQVPNGNASNGAAAGGDAAAAIAPTKEEAVEGGPVAMEGVE